MINILITKPTIHGLDVGMNGQYLGNTVFPTHKLQMHLHQKGTDLKHVTILILSCHVWWPPLLPNYFSVSHICIKRTIYVQKHEIHKEKEVKNSNSLAVTITVFTETALHRCIHKLPHTCEVNKELKHDNKHYKNMYYIRVKD